MKIAKASPIAVFRDGETFFLSLGDKPPNGLPSHLAGEAGSTT
jgi:hypothetical protein